MFGLKVLLTFGYFFGIIRANVPGTASYFLFDCAVAGLYAGIFPVTLSSLQRRRLEVIKPWLIMLIGWPCVLVFVPRQDFLLRLVGLRAAIWFLPFLLIGGMMDEEALSSIAIWLAVLNLVALGFGIAEYFDGLQRFYPSTPSPS